MYLSAESLSAFATAPAAQADELLKKFDAELIELKRQVVCCGVLLYLLVACLSNHTNQCSSSLVGVEEFFTPTPFVVFSRRYI